MQLNVNKTRVISFFFSNLFGLDYKFCETWLHYRSRSGYWLQTVFPPSSGLHIFSIRLLGLIRRVNFSFSSLQCLLMLYCTVKVRICLCYVELHYFYWCKTEHIQLNFLPLYHRRVFNNTEYNYVNVPKVHEISKFKCVRRRQLDAFFKLVFKVFQYFFLRVWKISTFK